MIEVQTHIFWQELYFITLETHISLVCCISSFKGFKCKLNGFFFPCYENILKTNTPFKEWDSHI
jgi:hypothetical protein